jgi:hypothetical protein
MEWRVERPAKESGKFMQGLVQINRTTDCVMWGLLFC